MAPNNLLAHFELPPKQPAHFRHLGLRDIPINLAHSESLITNTNDTETINCCQPYSSELANAAETSHARKIIAAHPEMLLDLECDPSIQLNKGEEYPPYFNGSHWEAICESLQLPDAVRYGTKTYHDWVFIDHKGVKIYYAGCKLPDSWMTLHPEPRFRTGGRGKGALAISGLPNWEKHRKAHILKVSKGCKISEDYISVYDTQRAIAKPVALEAIDLGWITPEGTKIPGRSAGYLPS